MPEAARPDRTAVFEDRGTLYCTDYTNPDAWLAYSGPITEAIN